MTNKITTDTEVSSSELACVLGITARYVRQLTEDGQLEKIKQGRYALCASVQKYIDSREAVTEDDAKLEKAKRAAEVTLKTSKAHIAKMEADELRGKMHRSEDVEAMTADLIYSIRGSLLALPGKRLPCSCKSCRNISMTRRNTRNGSGSGWTGTRI